MSYLAKVAGYELSFDKISREEMIKTSILAFTKGHREYIKMFEKITEPISYEEQIHFIRSIFMDSAVRMNKKTFDSMSKDIERYRSNVVKGGKINKKKFDMDLEL